MLLTLKKQIRKVGLADLRELQENSNYLNPERD
jgi:hypothetical protein